MLRVLNLEAGYGNLRVLKGVSMHVSPGEIVALIGANGAGKTTLLGAIAGVVRATDGEIAFDGRTIRNAPAEKIVSLGCALVPEGRQIFAPLSVQENLMLGAYARRGREGRAAAHARLEEVRGLFGVLGERQRQLAGTLSGGEQQMLAIGRALMSAPRCIMMDEPSMGIAPKVVKEIFGAVVRLRGKGLTVLLVEQNAKAALAIADRGYVLEAGRIVIEGSARDLLDNRDVQRAYLGKEYRRIDE
ncbi:MAG TPA: branched-chain amino acid ABC transporter ATP-binding protein [Planctomycetes bacterium]|nr:branched-chain amino acid ABC transporter ATP-binding protein [Planctomycetota bacterium]